MKIGDGRKTSFWYDSWSTMGRLYDLFGSQGCIDMGIPSESTVAMVMTTQRRRRHRADILNEVETIIEDQRSKLLNEDDISLWKQPDGKYRPVFKTKFTWEVIRRKEQRVSWWKGFWFKHHTPKYAFFHWIAIHNRLATGDRMQTWNRGVNSACILCRASQETRDHLFFECSYSSEVWSLLMSGLLQTSFTSKWSELLVLIMDNSGDFLTNFLTRYTLQAAIHSIWRERNERRHGAIATPARELGKLLDRHVRNRCCSIQQLGDQNYAGSLSRWFATR